MSTKDDLIAAKQALITRGRTRLVPINQQGCVCLIGAIAVTLDPEWAEFVEGGDSLYHADAIGAYGIVDDTPRGLAVANALTQAYYGEPFEANDQLWKIGDDEQITDDQLYALFDKAIESAE